MQGKETEWYEIHRYNRRGYDCEDNSGRFDTLEEVQEELKQLQRWFPKERFAIVKKHGTIIFENGGWCNR